MKSRLSRIVFFHVAFPIEALKRAARREKLNLKQARVLHPLRFEYRIMLIEVESVEISEIRRVGLL